MGEVLWCRDGSQVWLHYGLCVCVYMREWVYVCECMCVSVCGRERGAVLL